MSTSFILDILSRLKNHNPNMFHIFYGGEPLLRRDLPEIISFCNSNNIHYTIITNNSDSMFPKLQQLILQCGSIGGLTSSVDPIIYYDKESDRAKKSLAALRRLTVFKDSVKDLVAEVTIDNESVKYIYPLVEQLTGMGICSSVTFIDISKSEYYDFSNVEDSSILVQPSKELRRMLIKMVDDGLDIHMGKTLLNKIVDCLPSNLDCKIENNLHNLTIESDGTPRLCLRIKGLDVQRETVDMVINKNGEISDSLRERISKDKYALCQGCNWSCMIMSDLTFMGTVSEKEIIHSKKRI